MNKNCVVCNKELDGKKTKFCSHDCGNKEHNRKGNNKQFKNQKESLMWKWYWEVKLKDIPMERGMAQIWKYYDYKMTTERFVNTRI